MVENKTDASKRDSSQKKSRTFFLIGYACFVAMAFLWSLDASIVYIFFGLGSFLTFLGFYSRPVTMARTEERGYAKEERGYSKSYRPQGQREYTGASESFEDKIKEFFERKTSPSQGNLTMRLRKAARSRLQ
jgi:hypothetical protein